MQLVAGRAIKTTSDNHTLHNLECTIIQSRLPTPQSEHSDWATDNKIFKVAIICV